MVPARYKISLIKPNCVENVLFLYLKFSGPEKALRQLGVRSGPQAVYTDPCSLGEYLIAVAQFWIFLRTKDLRRVLNQATLVSEP